MADAKILGSDTPVATNMQRSLMTSGNSPLMPNLMSGVTMFERPVEYYVHVFNISRQSFPVNQPLFKGRVLPACPADKPYIEVARFPNVVEEKVVQADTGQITKIEYAGEHVAMDLIRDRKSVV